VDLKFTRVLVKLSGELFGGPKGSGFDYPSINALAGQVASVTGLGVRLGLVVGGGNIFRGTSSAPPGMDRVAADHMGMLATVINAISMQDALERLQVQTRVMTAIEIRQIAEPYIKRRADRHLEKGRVVIFAAGTGNPFFTTDTAAALRASEMGAQVLIKATKVDGVYNKDPNKFADAVRYEQVGYHEVLNRDLKVMDSTAVAFCKDNNIPILVLDIRQPDALRTAVSGGDVGTMVC
jgi:uridylate kinase